MITDATTIAELAEILRAKGVHSLRLSLHHSEAVINGTRVPITRAVARAKACTWRLATSPVHDRDCTGVGLTGVGLTVEAEDPYALHAALTRLLGALPDDETAALAKAGAR